jgi:hypothetical protein
MRATSTPSGSVRKPLASALAALLLLPGVAAAAGRWHPPQRLSWYWQLQGRVNNARPVAVYDIDGFDGSSAEVARLHAAGKRVICYLDAGTWEKWRPDAGRFPATALGRPNGWPGERWLDIRQPAVRNLIRARVGQQCARKHFDAVEFDNVDGFENQSGFPITGADQLSFNHWLAGLAHADGLAAFQKNDPEQALQLQPYFDGALVEQCNQYLECPRYRPYLAAGKPVLDAEYRLTLGQFCAADQRLGIMGARYDLALDGRLWEPCP